MSSHYAPVPPSQTYDWSGATFESLPSHGWVRMDYRNGAWGPMQWHTDMNISLPIHALGLHYGQAAFEGLKAMRSRDDRVHIFRPDENAKRLQYSSEVLSMPQLPTELFLEACELAVSRNLDIVPPYAPNVGHGSLYLRPILFASEGTLQLRPAKEYIFGLYVTPLSNLYGGTGGIVPAIDALIMESFDRTAPMGTGAAKLAGNYGPMLRHTAAAKQAGYGITLHLDSKTRSLIDEFSTSNCLAIKYDPARPDENVTLLVPTSPSILKSITTLSLVDIATQILGWQVELRPVAFAEMVRGDIQEVVAAGTAAGITPIRSITYADPDGQIKRLVIGNDSAGPKALKLFEALTSILAGDTPAPGLWLQPEGGVRPPSTPIPPLHRKAGEFV